MSGTIIRHSAPNSGKKRRPLSTLSRALPSPSHSAQISKIFQDAVVSLRAYDSASASSSLSKEKRMPVRQAQLTPFGRGSDSRTLKVRKAFKPGSSPELPPYEQPETPDEISSPLMLPSLPFGPSASGNGPKLPLGIVGGEPKTRNWSMINDPLQDPSPESSISSPPKTPPNPADIKIPSTVGSECHSSHRVPLVIPMTEIPHQKVEEIDNWLSEVNKASSTGVPRPKQHPRMRKEGGLFKLSPKTMVDDKQSRAPSNNKENRSTSNKENSNPLYPILPSANAISSFSPPRYSQTPSRFIPPLPKRKTPMPRIGAPPPCLPTTPIQLEERLKLQNDKEVVAVKPLSPDVQRYRKRRRPKRERCLSYWDTDIFEDAKEDLNEEAAQDLEGDNKKGGNRSAEEDEIESGNQSETGGSGGVSLEERRQVLHQMV